MAGCEASAGSPAPWRCVSRIIATETMHAGSTTMRACCAVGLRRQRGTSEVALLMRAMPVRGRCGARTG